MATRSSLHVCCLTLVKAAIIVGLLSVCTRALLAVFWERTLIDVHPKLVAHPIRIRTESSLWCSSPCPEGDKALFAIGTSDGLYTLEGLGSYWTLSKKPFASDVSTGKPIFHRRTDSSHALVTSVEWLSSTVIAAGLKDSTVFLHDLRSGGTATRLQHPHAVTKIRNLDPYRIVVAGINSVRTSVMSLSPS
jgi:WD40 repeat protein